MAIKLSKNEIERRDGFATSLRELEGKIEDAFREYNEAIKTLQEPVNRLIEEYNEVIEAARGFAEDIANEAQCVIDDKSERWQDGDKGQAAVAWQQEYENVELEAVEFSWPEDVEPSGFDRADFIEALPAEPEE